MVKKVLKMEFVETPEKRKSELKEELEEINSKSWGWLIVATTVVVLAVYFNYDMVEGKTGLIFGTGISLAFLYLWGRFRFEDGWAASFLIISVVSVGSILVLGQAVMKVLGEGLLVESLDKGDAPTLFLSMLIVFLGVAISLLAIKHFIYKEAEKKEELDNLRSLCDKDKSSYFEAYVEWIDSNEFVGEIHKQFIKRKRFPTVGEFLQIRRLVNEMKETNEREEHKKRCEEIMGIKAK